MIDAGQGTRVRVGPQAASDPDRKRVFEAPAALARHVADWIVDLAREGGRPFAICLSGGTTPEPIYRLLAAEPCLSRLPWDEMHWFWGDERFVPRDDPASNFRMAWESFLSRAPVPGRNIHAIPTEGLRPEAAAAEYEATLRRCLASTRRGDGQPLFDLTLLGLGPDGHIASLFPDSPALAEDRRWVVAVRTPMADRITLTYPALARSRVVAFLVDGARKRDALARVWANDVRLPAARLRPDGAVYWFADRAAAAGAPGS